jgi:hypothetical protein
MAADKVRTEFLFSYGTLQLEAVQMATFGRQLTGTSDALRGFELGFNREYARGHTSMPDTRLRIRDTPRREA